MTFTKQVFVFLIFTLAAFYGCQGQILPFGNKPLFGSIIGAATSTVDKVNSLPGSLAQHGPIGGLISLLPFSGGGDKTEGHNSITSNVPDATGSVADPNELTELAGAVPGLN